jgi:hypothetical protein
VETTSSMKANGITNQITFDGGSIQIVFGWLGVRIIKKGTELG